MNVAAVAVSPTTSIRHTMACIDRGARNVALVVDPDGRLIAVVTDGDIRRGILAGVGLESPVQALLSCRAPVSHPSPLTAPMNTPLSELLRMMQEHTLQHIPLLDDVGRVVDVAVLGDLLKDWSVPSTAVVMAGGYGLRLRPLTDEVPKSMLAIGTRPLLELIVDQLRQAGIRRVHLSTHYKADVIAQHFGDGRRFGVDIHYVNEHHALGTAGALGLIDNGDDPVLVVNGDILTRVDFRAMLMFHRESKAEATVAVRSHEFRVPYGVVDIDGDTITRIEEKPVLRYHVNGGIYVLSQETCRAIPKGQPCDMTDLIARLLAMGRRVVSFPVHEYWLDIGHLEDYRQAAADAEGWSA